MPGTKTAICELALVLAERGSTIVLPDPYYPDYPSGPALAGGSDRLRAARSRGRLGTRLRRRAAGRRRRRLPQLPLEPLRRLRARGDVSRARSLTRTRPAPRSSTTSPTATSSSTGARPQSFLAEPGAREVGVEMFSMSKTYGMAGWRLGFVVGNAEIVARLDLLADHVRVGIFAPVQHAGIAALTGPQDSVAERVATYQRRRDRVREVLPDVDRRGLVLPLVGAARRASRPSGCWPSTASRSRPARASARAARAGPGSRSRSRTRCSRPGSSGSLARSPSGQLSQPTPSRFPSK